MSSITGLGLRNKVGLGKSNDSSSKPKQQGSSITGLGLRNKAASLAGNKKDIDPRDRVVTPRSSLKDPSSFAPPPRHVNLRSAPTERQVDTVSQKGPLTPAEYRAREEERAKLEKEEAAREREQRRLDREEKQRLRSEEQEEATASGRSVPYRTDSTGLSTSQFTPPIARGVTADGTIVIRPTAPANQKPKPQLPPRLPDRQNSSPKIGGLSQPPVYGSAVAESSSGGGQSSRASFNTLGAASVSASGLRTSSQEQSQKEYKERPQLPARSSTGSSFKSPATPSDNPQLSELQSRFARMRASSSREEAPSQETMSTAQAVLQTSSSSSFQDGLATNTTFGSRNAPASINFQERHGEQVARGLNSAANLNQKHELSGNAASYNGFARKNLHPRPESETPIVLRDNTVLPVKKAPPPRPKKRAELLGISAAAGDAPPIPLSSKPR